MSERFGLPEHAIEQLCSIFQGYPEIERVLVYGSRAKGNYRPGSDIDLSLVAPAMSFDALLQIENRIDDLLLPWMIDLSLLHQIENSDLVAHINRVGVDLCTLTGTRASAQ
ncbi:nucleotidyltransferase domain-containing protein [Thiopseudomonas denitrificans]|uniref:Nucleotidyltransferase-like protein n=1 Tax=Thiopseudomonas denitrificans TaxID=1501432 RepID=A0A4R6U0T3_9GAMM|nr:nucleotidyltransferase domain-containing protein [Thiopseudomonas denitrificans]TDQ38842.1 nucleotidyltransferase-like protein [Thiopseudomonas denitrificans]